MLVKRSSDNLRITKFAASCWISFLLLRCASLLVVILW